MSDLELKRACLIELLIILGIWVGLKIFILIWAFTVMPEALKPLAILLLCVA